VLKKYPTQVKIAFKHFPLKNHKFARKAAAASLAAQRQGKFWEVHDLIFADYNKLNDAKIAEIVQKAGLNMAMYERDYADKKIQDHISRDFKDGSQAGVRGTPTIFINGKRLQNRSLKGFQQAIDLELKKLK
jgi:protein-disulfide isomerase